MDIYLLIYLVVFVAPIGTIVHEAGHAIGARLVKADKITLSIGVGKIIKSFLFQRVTIKVHAIFFLGGLSFSERNSTYNMAEKICIAISGPISNGLLVLILGFIFYPVSNAYIQLLVLFNMWLAVINVIPFKVKGKQSDGYSIIQAISQKK